MATEMVPRSAKGVLVEETQFCVGLEHKPGMLTRLCHLLRTEGVNIEALFVSNDADVAWVNFVAKPADRVEEALKKGRHKFFSESVLTVQVDNKPGEIEQIATRLADADVNINYVYGSGAGGHPSIIVLSVDDPPKAAQALKG
ncbi:MAG: ACT domain-containing protein [Phycisphaerae bacterium]